MENTVNLTIQGKGGIGKTLVSCMVAQWVQSNGFDVICADTDPVNSSFHQVTGLNASLVPITENGAVMQSMFDPLFETILEDKRCAVIDNGASTFLPLLKYIKANDVFRTLEDHGKRVYIHAIVTGGQAKDDTAQGLLSIFELVEGTNTKVVIWQNEFWGIPTFRDVPLEGMPWIKKNRDKIVGIVKIIDRNNDAFSADMRSMSEKHLTLSDIETSDDFKVFAKSRIRRVFQDVFDELNLVFDSELLHEPA